MCPCYLTQFCCMYGCSFRVLTLLCSEQGDTLKPLWQRDFLSTWCDCMADTSWLDLGGMRSWDTPTNPFAVPTSVHPMFDPRYMCCMIYSDNIRSRFHSLYYINIMVVLQKLLQLSDTHKYWISWKKMFFMVLYNIISPSISSKLYKFPSPRTTTAWILRSKVPSPWM